MEQDQPTIIARNLTKKFGDFTAVNAIDLDIQRGEIFGFLGPNGSGKTTTIRMMLGLIRPTAGFVEILGVRVSELPQKIRRRVGYMSQRFSLYNDLTVAQNLRFYGKAYGLNEEEYANRMETVLHQAGLSGREKVRTSKLAGGWRQRLALGAAILHRPEIIFLDEPTAGVDPVSRREFWGLLYQLAADGVTVFVTTHYMDEAEHCQRLALIQNGQLIAVGSPLQIKAELMPDQVLEITPSDPAEAVRVLEEARERGYLSIMDIELYGAKVHLLGRDLLAVQRTVEEILRASGVMAGQAHLIEPSLEDVFISSMK